MQDERHKLGCEGGERCQGIILPGKNEGNDENDMAATGLGDGVKHQSQHKTENSDTDASTDASSEGAEEGNHAGDSEGDYESSWDESDDDEEPDGLELVDAIDPYDGSGADCELHVYESRKDTRGDRVLLRVGVKHDFERPKDRSHAAALVLVRYYNDSSGRIWNRISLEIRSPHLKTALREVIKSYPGIDFKSGKSIMLTDNAAWSLFHYQKELEEFANSSNDDDLKSHMNLLMQYADRIFQKEIAEYNATVGSEHSNPGLEFANLWMAFKPGELLYKKVNGVDRLFVFDKMARYSEGKAHDRWWLSTRTVECNGQDVGYVHGGTAIVKYDGYKAFSLLSIFPVRFHNNREGVKKRLLSRGAKYISSIGIHHCQYHGKARVNQRGGMPTRFDSWLLNTQVQQRIIVDFEECHNGLSGKPLIFPEESMIGSASSDLEVNDTILMACSHEVPAYTLDTKKWGWFNVEDIQPVAFNNEGFDNLVLPREKKELISSLIVSSKLPGFSTDDFVQGKGKAVIILLHGPPGVGKTFTAEVMADYARRPLLTVNSSHFSARQLPGGASLSQLLHYATRWQAVVLVDEADVYMQARGLQDLGRNGMVSMLLQTLEYFEGTLFLTTNRVGTIDSAFMSRIQLALSYNPLSAAAKRQLWKTWITRACGAQCPVWANEDLLDQLSRLNVSGRDIKNISLLAQGLARAGQRDMMSEDILKGANAMTQFQEDFRSSVTHQESVDMSDPQAPAARPMPSGSWLKTLRQWWGS